MRRVAGTDHHNMLDTDGLAHLVDDRCEERVRETHGRVGVAEDVLELLGSQPQVERVDEVDRS